MKPDNSAPPLEIRLFGTLELNVHGVPAPRFRSQAGGWLLALLALRHSRDMDRSWLAATLWPDSTEEQALYNLRRNLTDFRRVLGAESSRLLSPTPRTLRLNLVDSTCDVIQFDAAVKRGDEVSMKSAVALYRGELLEGCDEDWVFPERCAREEMTLAALERLASQNAPPDAIPYLRQVIAIDPLRESAHRRLMEALAALGDHAALTRVFRDLRTAFYRDLGTEPSAETTELYRKLHSEGRSSAPAPPPPTSRASPPQHAASSGSLPTYLTSLVGREQEQEEVIAALNASRLVTLLGTGGVGKTRLAVAVSGRLREPFAEGVWFVDLAPVADSALLPEIVAGVLGLYDEPGREWGEILKRFLASRSLLLVLDNCEHLLEACTQLCRTLLGQCPNLRILATSRQPLGLPGERIWRVPSLSMPPSGEGETPSPETLMEYEAVQLFIERSKNNELSFRLTPENAESVTAICRQVDGIPLALELAAARIRGLSALELASRLLDSFRILSVEPHGGSQRQQALRATMDWSYRLLSDRERWLLQRLSVFAGGWRLDAAETVCSDDALDKSEVLERLSALVDRSLVLLESGTGRYRLLETIRQYACEHLKESGNEPEARHRHLRWCLTYVNEVESRRDVMHSADWVQRLSEELDNFRAALDGALRPGGEEATEAQDERLILGLQLAVRLHRFWAARDLFSEGRTLLDAFLSRTESRGATPLRAQAWSALGQLACAQGNYETATPTFEEALRIYHAHGMEEEETLLRGLIGVTQCHQGNFFGARPLMEEAYPLCERLRRYEGVAILDALAFAVREQGDYRTARAHLERAIALARKVGDLSGQADCLFNLGYVSLEEDSPEEAPLRFQEALGLFQRVGNRTGEARCLCAMGSYAMIGGDLDTSFDLVNRALEINRRVGHIAGEAWNYAELGEVRLAQGRYLEAQRYYEESLAINRESHSRNSQAWNLVGIASTALYLGDYRKSFERHREALELMQSLGMKRGMITVLESLSEVYRLDGRSASSAQLLSAMTGIREEVGIPANENVRHGRELHMAELRDALGEEAFEEAWRRGAGLSLQDAVDLVMEEVKGDPIPGPSPARGREPKESLG